MTSPESFAPSLASAVIFIPLIQLSSRSGLLAQLLSPSNGLGLAIHGAKFPHSKALGRASYVRSPFHATHPVESPRRAIATSDPLTRHGRQQAATNAGLTGGTSDQMVRRPQASGARHAVLGEAQARRANVGDGPQVQLAHLPRARALRALLLADLRRAALRAHPPDHPLPAVRGVGARDPRPRVRERAAVAAAPAADPHGRGSSARAAREAGRPAAAEQPRAAPAARLQERDGPVADAARSTGSSRQRFEMQQHHGRPARTGRRSPARRRRRPASSSRRTRPRPRPLVHPRAPSRPTRRTRPRRRRRRRTAPCTTCSASSRPRRRRTRRCSASTRRPAGGSSASARARQQLERRLEAADAEAAALAGDKGAARARRRRRSSATRRGCARRGTRRGGAPRTRRRSTCASCENAGEDRGRAGAERRAAGREEGAWQEVGEEGGRSWRRGSRLRRGRGAGWVPLRRKRAIPVKKLEDDVRRLRLRNSKLEEAVQAGKQAALAFAAQGQRLSAALGAALD